MKIAFVIPSLSNSGGMERVMSEIINYISRTKHDELHLVMFGPGNEKLFFEIPDNVIISRPDFGYSDSKRSLYAVKAMLFVRKAIKKISPDTILSFGEIWNNFVMLSLLGLHFPIFISDRCRPNKSFGKLHDTLRKLLYPRATGIIAQTQKAKDIYATQFKHDNVAVIGNPIKHLSDDRVIERENIVISVGRLIDTKHFDQLIEIFSKINKPDWKLVIVGGDALRQTNSVTLKKQIDVLGMTDRIILAGTQKDVNAYLLKAKIFAFTSSSEGFPNAIGEAMSAGLPVVAYDCIAGPSDMINDGENGFLIPLFDEDTFENKLRFLMEHEEESHKMGKNAKESIKRFSVEDICTQFYKVLKSKEL